MDEVLKHGSGAAPSGWVGSNMVAWPRLGGFRWPFTCILVCRRLAFQRYFCVVLGGLSGEIDRKSTGNREEIDWKSTGNQSEINRKSIGTLVLMTLVTLARPHDISDPCDPVTLTRLPRLLARVRPVTSDPCDRVTLVTL